jgi:hypothetical protein
MPPPVEDLIYAWMPNASSKYVLLVGALRLHSGPQELRALHIGLCFLCWCEALHGLSQYASQLGVSQWACSCQFPVEPIDVSLFLSELPVFSRKLLFHLIQPPTQGSNDLVFHPL